MRSVVLALVLSACGGQKVDYIDLVSDPPRDLASAPAHDLGTSKIDDFGRAPADLAEPLSDLASAPVNDLATSPPDMTPVCTPILSACSAARACCLSWSALPMDAMNVQSYCDPSLGCVLEYQIRDNCFGAQIRQCTVDGQHGTVCAGCA